MICLDVRAQSGLRWLKTWARGHITRLKRRRKYLPRGAPFDPQEMTTLKALLDLEAAAEKLMAGEEKAK